MPKETIYPWWEIRETLHKPEPPSWLINNIAELSKNTRTLHVLYVTFLIYCGITILSSTDRKIILDETAHLPVIGSELPYASFMLAAPLTAIFLFVYFHLHLNALVRTIHALRTNYAPIEKGRLYPWMITLVEEHESGVMQRLERMIISVSLWWLLPIVQLLFFLLALKKTQGWHQFEFLLLVMVGALVFWFWYHYEAITFKAPETEKILKKLRGYIRRHKEKMVLASCTIFFPLYIGVLIPARWFYVDLHNQVLINEQKYGIYSADLQSVNLERANLSHTVLKGADLRKATFTYARLEHAILEGADLSFTTLSKASLKETNLRGAILISAVLDGANLQGADLQDANLQDAYIREADLRGAKIGIEQLSRVATLYKTVVDEPLENEISKKYPDLWRDPVEREKSRKSSPDKGNNKMDGITDN